MSSEAPPILIPVVPELGEHACHPGMAEGGTAAGRNAPGAAAAAMILGEMSGKRAVRPTAGSLPQPLDLPTFTPSPASHPADASAEMQGEKAEGKHLG